jgi:hypothetical protein
MSHSKIHQRPAWRTLLFLAWHVWLGWMSTAAHPDPCSCLRRCHMRPGQRRKLLDVPLGLPLSRGNAVQTGGPPRFSTDLRGQLRAAMRSESGIIPFAQAGDPPPESRNL